jgi:hypothetical protein
VLGSVLAVAIKQIAVVGGPGEGFLAGLHVGEVHLLLVAVCGLQVQHVRGNGGDEANATNRSSLLPHRHVS